MMIFLMINLGNIDSIIFMSKSMNDSVNTEWLIA